MPRASPSVLPRSATVGSFIRCSISAGRTCVPLSARPSPRWNLAQRSWSPTEEAMPPPGLRQRGPLHSRATESVPSSPGLWPTANRLVMASSGVKKLWDSPNGSRTNEAMARSYVVPVIISTIRPSRLYPAWL
jgi:hypothetical protein